MAFDEAYYQRYYEDPRTRVITDEELARLVGFLAGYLAYLDIQPKSIADLGCGTGAFRAPLATHFPKAKYTGVEVSAYACERHGWVHSAIAAYRPRRRFDLVICYDVFQYLDDDEAAESIDRLGALTAEVLFFGSMTRADWDESCDRDRTDGNAYLREGTWYRERLSRYFLNLGGGVFLKRDANTVVFELEHIG